MKIISVDAILAGADLLIAENVNEFYGKLIAELLNEREGYHSQNHFVLREDSYVLREEPEDLEFNYYLNLKVEQ
jgi:hypothetical protein